MTEPFKLNIEQKRRLYGLHLCLKEITALEIHEKTLARLLHFQFIPLIDN